MGKIPYMYVFSGSNAAQSYLELALLNRIFDYEDG